LVKILGISGSPRNAATEFVLKRALEEASKVDGVSTELITLRGKKINFCIHCDKCVKEGADRCAIYNDDMTSMYDTLPL